MSGKSFILYAILAVLLFASCLDGQHAPSEADLSAFGSYVYRLDTAKLQDNLQALIAADTSRWRADQTVRQYYSSGSPAAGAQDAEPDALNFIWFSRSGVSPDADSIVALLRRELPRNGLDSAAFFLSSLAGDLDVVHRLAFDSLGIDINQLLPRLDYRLTQAYVRYTAGQRRGFLRPAKLLNNLDFKSGGPGYARLFDYDVPAPDYDEALRQACDPDARLAYLVDSHPSGPVYEALVRQLDSLPSAEQRRTLAVNIERCRWQMPQLPSSGRRILVNIPAQQLWAIAPDSIMNMRICCGTVLTKTPLLTSAITHMQVNPDWIIPQNIVRNEVVRHAGDSAYFARNRYYIVDRTTGDTLSPRHVTAAQMQSGRLRIGQHSGRGNSLGRIVFRFPNDFAIYLHDTNNPSAFQRERRTLSHGCIRVQRPFDLASFLLPGADEWTLDRLRLSMDLQPQSERGIQYLKDLRQRQREDPAFVMPQPLRLLSYSDVKPNVPVHITYFTAYPDPQSGTLRYYPDLYNYDKLLSRALHPFLLY